MKKIVPQSCKAVPLVIWSSDSLSEEKKCNNFLPPVSKSSTWNWYSGSIHCMFFMCKRLFCQCWVFLSCHFLCESVSFCFVPGQLCDYKYIHIHLRTYMQIYTNVVASWRQKCWQNLGQHQLWRGMSTKIIAALLHLQRRQHPPTLWIKHAAKQYMIGWYVFFLLTHVDVVFQNPFAGGAKAVSAQRTLIFSS